MILLPLLKDLEFHQWQLQENVDSLFKLHLRHSQISFWMLNQVSLQSTHNHLLMLKQLYLMHLPKLQINFYNRILVVLRTYYYHSKQLLVNLSHQYQLMFSMQMDKLMQLRYKKRNKLQKLLKHYKLLLLRKPP